MTDHDTPLISVIIPTKDRSALLGQALASAAELARSGLKLELIVVDNGSTDATLTVASSFQARIVRAPVPGAAAARNAGMRAATGDYLAFLDDDDVWLAGHLRPHIDLLEQNPTMAAVVGQVQTADFDLNPIGLPWPAVTAPRQDPFHMFLRQYPQIGATVVRASVRESVGDFDETLVGDEDWDWHLRLALRHDVGFVRTPCVLFRQRPIAVGAEME
ncbi:MAG: glycosyltransferase family 2 protein [Dehalococcoidia bacterium]